MPRSVPILLLMALLVGPSVPAVAATNEPVQIRVAEEQVGDRLLFALTMPDGGATAIELVEGRSTALDGFGLLRDTVSYRIDSFADNGTLLGIERCHRLATGTTMVRRDTLYAAHAEDSDTTARGDPLVGTSTVTTNASIISWFNGACPRAVLAGRTLREGETLTLGDLVQGRAPRGAETLVSRAATATTFHGRPALEFRFLAADVYAALDTSPTRSGELRFVLADGLPGVVLSEAGVPPVEGRSEPGHRKELVAYAPGEGGPSPTGTEALPMRHPDAAFTPVDGNLLALDALELPFPFGDAYAAIRADPQVLAERWFEQHPDALVVSAMYVSGFPTVGVPQEVTRNDGSWMILYSDDSSSKGFHVQRTSGADTPSGVIALPASVPVVQSFDMDPLPPGRSAEILNGPSLASIAATHGIAAGTTQTLFYSNWYYGGPELSLRQVPIFASEEGEGFELHLNLSSGRATFLGTISVTTTRSPGLLPIAEPDGGVDRPGVTGLAALLAPTGLSENAVGTAAATAAGLGVLAFLAKVLLLPLYMRLKRDRLLDHPVRAKLFARIRAEPGVHRAMLLQLTGLSEGATRHHLEQLIAHRLVVELVHETYARYFVAGDVPPEEAIRIAALRGGRHAEVYALYAHSPTLPLREAARRLGMSAPSVHRAKKKLQAAGLLPAGLPPAERVAEA